MGTSLAQTFHERLDQFHTLRLEGYLAPFNPAVSSFSEKAQALFLKQTGDPAMSQQMALQGLESLRQQQTSSLAYLDCFWLFAVLALVLMLLVLLMKPLGGREGCAHRCGMKSAAAMGRQLSIGRKQLRQTSPGAE